MLTLRSCGSTSFNSPREPGGNSGGRCLDTMLSAVLKRDRYGFLREEDDAVLGLRCLSEGRRPAPESDEALEERIDTLPLALMLGVVPDELMWWEEELDEIEREAGNVDIDDDDWSGSFAANVVRFCWSGEVRRDGDFGDAVFREDGSLSSPTFSPFGLSSVCRTLDQT
jgi:hypothetical protein